MEYKNTKIKKSIIYIMLCLQLIVYVLFIIIQTLLSKFVFNISISITNLIMPLLLVVLLHYLCVNYHFTVANVLIVLVLVLGIISDIYIIFNKNNIKQVVNPTLQPSTTSAVKQVAHPASQQSTAAASQQSTAAASQQSTAPASQQSTAPASQQSTAPASQQTSNSAMHQAAQFIQPFGTGSGTNYSTMSF